MPNRLAAEPSLYLRQHANNPVDWYPWGPEALEAARAQNKPLVVSIGYSACHWCHVMERECFEDAYIAGLMNDHFVCIKVDREERPDIDQIYMEAVQMLNGHGGWPLNVFCLPDGRPFFGGTYFPPEDTGQGIVPWPQLLMRIADYYKRSRSDLEENAENILKNMAHANLPLGADGSALSPQALLRAGEGICSQHDDDRGGFGSAPKFPPSMAVDFLLALRGSRAVESTKGLAQRLDFVLQKTLDGMAMGGIYDQIGGGFCRYSVDAQWQIPHFEKMLYDNALLLDAYAKAWLRTGRHLYAAVLEETVGWLEREMAGDGKGFAASLDADSEGEEGKYYVWRPEQIEEVLGKEDAEMFCALYGVTPAGNFEHATTNPVLATDDFMLRTAATEMRAKLLEARQERVSPGRDPKRLLSWNSLMVRGLTTAAFALDRGDWFARARETADWLWENCRDAEGRLSAVMYPDGPRHRACLDDHADFIQANLALAAYAEVFGADSATYIARAQELLDVVIKRFRDEHAAGFFYVADDHEELAARKKDWLDNARPAGNSSLVHCFAQRYALTGKSEYAAELGELRKCYTGLAERAPSAVAHALAGFCQEAVGIAVIKCKDADPAALAAALRERPWRPLFILPADVDGPSGYQLCVGTQCLEPMSDPAEVAELL